MRVRSLAVVVGLSVMGCGGGAVECPAPTGLGTEHSGAQTLVTSETWTAADGPHLVTGDLRIGAGGVLTIEPCAEVRMRAPNGIIVQEGGTLLAEGKEKQPITVKPEDAATTWGAVQVFGPSTARLAWVTLEGGGNELGNPYGALEVRGDQLAPAQELVFVDHVAITHSAKYGLSMRAGATLTKDSHDLSISGSKLAPIRALPRLVTNLPQGTYTGNTQDWVQIETEAYGEVSLENVTFHDLGVPYVVGGGVTVGELKVAAPSGLVTLTLEPGVVMKFNRDQAAGLVIDTGSTDNPAKGALVAVGTDVKPIVLTSAAPFQIAGDWRGIIFGNRPDISDKLDFVHLEYAGGPSQANGFHCRPGGLLSIDEDAAISMYGQPTYAFVTNTDFLSSAGLGVNLAYKGMTYNFLATNTFRSVVGCKQSTPRNQDNSCPSDVSCP